MTQDPIAFERGQVAFGIRAVGIAIVTGRVLAEDSAGF